MNENNYENGNSQTSGGQPPQGNNPYGQQPNMGWPPPPQGYNPYGQQPNMGWQQPPQGYNPYGQQPNMGWQQPPQGYNPYGQQPNMGWQQPPQGYSPYGQQPNMGWQQPPQGYNPYGQQPNMGWTPPPQAAPYSNPEDWKAPPQGFFYNVGPNVAWYHAYMQQWELTEKKNAEKKKIKEIGKMCGLPALLFVVLSFAFNLGLSILIEIFPSLGNTTALLGFDIIVSLLSLGLPFVLSFFLMRKKQVIPKLPYQKPADTKTAVFLTMVSIPAMVFSSIIINYISLIIQTIIGVEFLGGMSSNAKYSPLGMVLLFISVAIVPAIIEEFAIRGVVMQPLLKYGEKFAILASALFFSLLHGNMFQIPYTFVGGLILGYLLIKTKSIWPPIILHFVNNGYSALIVIFSNIFGERWGDISVYIMWLIFIVIGIIGGIGYYVNRPKENLSEGESVLKIGEKLGAFVGNWQMITMIIVFALLVLINTNF